MTFQKDIFVVEVSAKKQHVIEVFADVKIENEILQTIAVEQLTLENEPSLTSLKSTTSPGQLAVTHGTF